MTAYLHRYYRETRYLWFVGIFFAILPEWLTKSHTKELIIDLETFVLFSMENKIERFTSQPCWQTSQTAFKLNASANGMLPWLS